MPGTGLRHISLKTTDLKRTELFYTDVLGLEVAFRAPPKRVFFRSPRGDDLVDFVKSRAATRATQGLDHFGFRVARRSLKQIEKRLKEHRVKIEGRRGKESVYFRDPNGYRLEFYCD